MNEEGFAAARGRRQSRWAGGVGGKDKGDKGDKKKRRKTLHKLDRKALEMDEGSRSQTFKHSMKKKGKKPEKPSQAAAAATSDVSADSGAQPTQPKAPAPEEFSSNAPARVDEAYYEHVGNDLSQACLTLADHECSIIWKAADVISAIPEQYPPRRYVMKLCCCNTCCGRCCNDVNHKATGFHKTEKTDATTDVPDDEELTRSGSSDTSTASLPKVSPDSASITSTEFTDESKPIAERVIAAAQEAKRAIAAAKQFRSASKTIQSLECSSESEHKTRKQYARDLMEKAVVHAKRAREALTKYRVLKKAIRKAPEKAAEITQNDDIAGLELMLRQDEGTVQRQKIPYEANLDRRDWNDVANLEPYAIQGGGYYASTPILPSRPAATLQPSSRTIPFPYPPPQRPPTAPDAPWAAYGYPTPQYAAPRPRWSSAPEILVRREKPVSVESAMNLARTADMAISKARQAAEEATKLQKVSAAVLSEAKSLESSESGGRATKQPSFDKLSKNVFLSGTAPRYEQEEKLREETRTAAARRQERSYQRAPAVASGYLKGEFTEDTERPYDPRASQLPSSSTRSRAPDVGGTDYEPRVPTRLKGALRESKGRTLESREGSSGGPSAGTMIRNPNTDAPVRVPNTDQQKLPVITSRSRTVKTDTDSDIVATNAEPQSDRGASKESLRQSLKTSSTTSLVPKKRATRRQSVSGSHAMSSSLEASPKPATIDLGSDGNAVIKAIARRASLSAAAAIQLQERLAGKEQVSSTNPQTTPSQTGTKTPDLRSVLPLEEGLQKESARKESVQKEPVAKDSVQEVSVPKESVPKESVPKESVPKEPVPNESVPKESLLKETSPKKPSADSSGISSQERIAVSAAAAEKARAAQITVSPPERKQALKTLQARRASVAPSALLKQSQSAFQTRAARRASVGGTALLAARRASLGGAALRAASAASLGSKEPNVPAPETPVPQENPQFKARAMRRASVSPTKRPVLDDNTIDPSPKISESSKQPEAALRKVADPTLTQATPSKTRPVKDEQVNKSKKHEIRARKDETRAESFESMQASELSSRRSSIKNIPSKPAGPLEEPLPLARKIINVTPSPVATASKKIGTYDIPTKKVPERRKTPCSKCWFSACCASCRRGVNEIQKDIDEGVASSENIPGRLQKRTQLVRDLSEQSLDTEIIPSRRSKITQTMSRGIESSKSYKESSESKKTSGKDEYFSSDMSTIQHLKKHDRPQKQAKLETRATTDDSTSLIDEQKPMASSTEKSFAVSITDSSGLKALFENKTRAEHEKQARKIEDEGKVKENALSQVLGPASLVKVNKEQPDQIGQDKVPEKSTDVSDKVTKDLEKLSEQREGYMSPLPNVTGPEVLDKTVLSIGGVASVELINGTASAGVSASDKGTYETKPIKKERATKHKARPDDEAAEFGVAKKLIQKGTGVPKKTPTLAKDGKISKMDKKSRGKDRDLESMDSETETVISSAPLHADADKPDVKQPSGLKGLRNIDLMVQPSETYVATASAPVADAGGDARSPESPPMAETPKSIDDQLKKSANDSANVDDEHKTFRADLVDTVAPQGDILVPEDENKRPLPEGTATGIANVDQKFLTEKQENVAPEKTDLTKAVDEEKVEDIGEQKQPVTSEKVQRDVPSHEASQVKQFNASENMQQEVPSYEEPQVKSELPPVEPQPGRKDEILHEHSSEHATELPAKTPPTEEQGKPAIEHAEPTPGEQEEGQSQLVTQEPHEGAAEKGPEDMQLTVAQPHLEIPSKRHSVEIQGEQPETPPEDLVTRRHPAEPQEVSELAEVKPHDHSESFPEISEAHGGMVTAVESGAAEGPPTPLGKPLQHRAGPSSWRGAEEMAIQVPRVYAPLRGPERQDVDFWDLSGPIALYPESRLVLTLSIIGIVWILFTIFSFTATQHKQALVELIPNYRTVGNTPQARFRDEPATFQEWTTETATETAPETTDRRTLQNPTPPHSFYACGTPYCEKEGRYLTSVLSGSPCVNFYSYACKIQTALWDPAVGSSVSEDTLFADHVEGIVADYILNRNHPGMTAARSLFSTCMSQEDTNNWRRMEMNELFFEYFGSSWPVENKPVTVEGLWVIAGHLVRDLKLEALASVSVDVHPENKAVYITGIDEPKLIYRDDDFGLSTYTQLLNGAIDQSIKFMNADATNTGVHVSNIRQTMVLLSKLVAAPELRHLGAENYRLAKIRTLIPGVRAFLRSIFSDAAGVTDGTDVLVKSPLFFENLEHAKMRELEPQNLLNYLGFRIIVHFSVFLPQQSLRELRAMEADIPLRQSVQLNKFCIREVERLLPALFLRAYGLRTKSLGVLVESWTAKLQRRFIQGLARVAWIRGSKRLGSSTENDIRLAKSKLLSHRIVKYIPAWVLRNTSFLQYHRILQRHLQVSSGLDPTSVLKRFRHFTKLSQQSALQELFVQNIRNKPLSSVFDTAVRYDIQRKRVHVPLVVVNSSVPVNSTAFVIHIARYGVRIFKAFIPALYQDYVYETDQHGEEPLLFSDDYQDRLDKTVKCLLEEYRKLGGQLKSALLKSAQDLTSISFALLEQTLALMQSYWMFQELLKIKRVWRSDFRLAGLSELTSEQLFFVAYALDNCEASDNVFTRHQFQTAFRLPPEDRVNFPLSQFKEFAEAFSCNRSLPMARCKRCSIFINSGSY